MQGELRRIIRSTTIFLLAVLVVILTGVVAGLIGFSYGFLVDRFSLEWQLGGLFWGFVAGIIVGFFLSLRFANYFRAKIWPSETETPSK